jgi:hypothetical protein
VATDTKGMNSKSSGGYPNLIIAGAPKCGTSSLFFWLSAHPEICASKVKETYFLADQVMRFNKDLNVHEHGLEAYKHYFKHCGSAKYRAEATPVYIYHKTPLQYIAQLPEIPKVIFILRNPADRLYSHWRFNRYRMKNTKMTFQDYLDYNNAPVGWANYLEHTRYIRYIEKWVKTFGKEKFLVYQFESLRNDRLNFMNVVSADLGINPKFYDSFNFFHRNETVSIEKKWLHKWGLKMEPLIPQKVQECLIPVYLRLNSKEAPPISEKELMLKNEIAKRYRKDNERLAQLFPNIDLSLWQSSLHPRP